MKHLVVSIRRPSVPNAFNNVPDITICAELNSKDLADELMKFYNKTDRGQFCEIHSVMNDEETEGFLKNYSYVMKNA